MAHIHSQYYYNLVIYFILFLLYYFLSYLMVFEIGVFRSSLERKLSFFLSFLFSTNFALTIPLRVGGGS